MLPTINKARSGFAYVAVSNYSLTGTLKSSKSFSESLTYYVYTRVVELALKWEVTFYSNKSLVLKKIGLLSTGCDFLVVAFVAKSNMIYWRKREARLVMPGNMPCTC